MQQEQPGVSQSYDYASFNEHSPKKRKTEGDFGTDHVTSAINDSDAAQYNHRLLKRLQRAFQNNAEVDLLSQFPKDYPNRIKLKIGSTGGRRSELVKPILNTDMANDIRSMIDIARPVEVVYSLSSSVQQLLSEAGDSVDGSKLSHQLSALLLQAEAIYQGPMAMTRTIFKCDSGTVIKVIHNAEDYTEYTMLQYLQKTLPNFPAPKPLGLLRAGTLSFIFTSYIAGDTLKAVWPELSSEQKHSIMDQVNEQFSRLRAVDHDPRQPLGGIQGEGCKDFRRNLRRADGLIYTTKQYNEFLLSKARFGSKVYLDFLRGFATEVNGRICLSHGDARPDNIIVQKGETGNFVLSGLVDWEFSGFYPHYYESTKATNCLSTTETSDWYNYLPACLSPYPLAQQWLWDYVVGRLLE